MKTSNFAFITFFTEARGHFVNDPMNFGDDDGLQLRVNHTESRLKVLMCDNKIY